jgi:predicted ATPase
MLTRLRVQGFKNLVDVDLRLGPFTVVAGANGVGKSNLFDAIQLLSSLADKSLLDAATGVRQETSSANAIRIFTLNAQGQTDTIRFEVEMLVGPTVRDDLDQEASPSARHLRYTLVLRHTHPPSSLVPRIEIVHESLDYLNKDQSNAALPFAKRKRAWLQSVQGGYRTKSFISSGPREDGTYIKIHEDSGHQGRPRELKASTLTRTVLSTINTVENPTALAARREMQSWRLLQLEPSRLRAPSEWREKPELGLDGSGMPATLHRLLHDPRQDPEDVEARLVGRLFDLIGDIRTLQIDRDEKRETFTVLVGFKDGLTLRARELSDGTLRFLALATLEADLGWSGLLCMEEPENGIHPSRIPAMLRLLKSIAVNLNYPVGEDNPLRQVILNTHSPEVVGLTPETALIVAVQGWTVAEGIPVPSAEFRPLDSTWRDGAGVRYTTKSQVLDYLQALPKALEDPFSSFDPTQLPVAGRPEIRPLFAEELA